MYAEECIKEAFGGRGGFSLAYQRAWGSTGGRVAEVVTDEIRTNIYEDIEDDIYGEDAPRRWIPE